MRQLELKTRERPKFFDTSELNFELWATQVLQDHFSRADLRQLCFELHIDWESFPSMGKNLIAIEIAGEMKRQKRLPELKKQIADKRPFLRYDDEN